LLGGTVELLNTFCWLPLVNPKCRRALGTFLCEDALSLANSREGFRVIRRNFLLIPGHTVVASP
jgi:hypothetical protein